MTKVLYIDDDATMSLPLVEGLRLHGLDVSYLRNAEAALAEVRSTAQWDIIILDIMMRKCGLEAQPHETQTGYILYRLIRDSWPNVPIIALTVLASSDAPKGVIADPQLVWLRKPVRYRDLISRIGKALDSKGV